MDPIVRPNPAVRRGVPAFLPGGLSSDEREIVLGSRPELLSRMGRITRVFGQHDEKTLKQLEDVASRADAAALMADGHLGYVMPIGGVAAYDEKVSVVGVGFDIACGNAAIRTDLRADAYSREDWELL